ncbi:hypothetical protein pb186bvf_014222 [Paramecium bursaria]
MQQVSQGRQLFDGIFVEIFFNTNGIDPLDPQNMVIMPLLLITNTSGSFQTLSEPYINDQGQYSVKIQDMSLDNSDNYQEYQLTFGECVPRFILDSSRYKCANKTYVDQYFSQIQNFLSLKSFTTEFSSKYKQTQKINQVYLFAIDSNITFFSQINTKVGVTEIDDGLLFQNQYSTTYLSDIIINTQTLNQEYFKRFVGFTVYQSFYFRKSSLQLLQSVEYPKINSVLADIGSIISIILAITYIIQYINDEFLIREMEKKVISIYYPEIDYLKIDRKWNGQITNIYNQKSKQTINHDFFSQYYQELRSIANKKLQYTNIIYELSRLQFTLQSLQYTEQLKAVHKVGIRLKQQQKLEIQNVSFEYIRPNQISPDSEMEIHERDQIANLVTNDQIRKPKQSHSPLIQNTSKQDLQEEETVKQQYRILNDEDFRLLLPDQEIQINNSNEFFQLNEIL